MIHLVISVTIFQKTPSYQERSWEKKILKKLFFITPSGRASPSGRLMTKSPARSPVLKASVDRNIFFYNNKCKIYIMLNKKNNKRSIITKYKIQFFKK